MPIKIYNRTSAGRRNSSVNTYSDVTCTTPTKSLLVPAKKTGGRNNQGRITSRHIGGGHIQKYRVIDFKRSKDGIPARVASIEYDPNRTANIALLFYVDGEKRYILAPDTLKVLRAKILVETPAGQLLGGAKGVRLVYFVIPEHIPVAE